MDPFSHACDHDLVCMIQASSTFKNASSVFMTTHSMAGFHTSHTCFVLFVPQLAGSSTQAPALDTPAVSESSTPLPQVAELAAEAQLLLRWVSDQIRPSSAQLLPPSLLLVLLKTGCNIAITRPHLMGRLLPSMLALAKEVHNTACRDTAENWRCRGLVDLIARDVTASMILLTSLRLCGLRNRQHGLSKEGSLSNGFGFCQPAGRGIGCEPCSGHYVCLCTVCFLRQGSSGMYEDAASGHFLHHSARVLLRQSDSETVGACVCARAF